MSKEKRHGKSFILLMLTLVIMLLVAAGCGNTSPTASPSEQPNKQANDLNGKSEDVNKESEPPLEKVTLRFSWWGGEGRHTPYLAAIEEYERLNPHVKIEGEYQSFDGYQQKMFTQLSSDSSPDIMQLSYVWYPDLATRGDLFVDFYDQDIVDISGFDQAFSKEYGDYNGKMIALPLGTNTGTIVANKTLADKLGVPLDVDYDWEALIELGKKLHDEDPEFYLLNSDVNTLNIAVQAMLKQRTGDQLFNEDYTISFTEEDLVYVYDLVARALEAGALQPASESQLFSGKTEQSPLWINQKTMFNLSYASSTLRFQATAAEGVELVTLKYPTILNPKQGSSSVGPTFMASVKRSSPHADEALKFLNWFLNDEEAAIILGDSRSVPPTEIQRKIVMEKEVMNPEIVKAVEMGFMNSQTNNNAISTNTELEALMLAQIEKVAFKQSSIEKIAAESMKLLGEKLEQLKKSAK